MSEKLKILAIIPGDRKKEIELHKTFSHLRIKGEWFESKKDLMDFINNVKKNKEPFHEVCLYPMTVKKLKRILNKANDNAIIYLDVDYANTDGFDITGVLYNGGKYVQFITNAILHH